jgi:predicted outer membrane lipoprotein
MKKKAVKKEFVEKLGTLIVSAFGLVAALAWNDTIKMFISQFLDKSDGLVGTLVYALIVTFLAVLVTMSVSKWKN